MQKSIRFATFATIFLLSFTSRPADAQIDNTFSNLFDRFLRIKLDQADPSIHGRHYFPAADLADSLLTPALNGLIASNISSFPLSSTIAGISLDFSTGRPRLLSESLGPIFAETAESIGPGKLNIGINYSYLNLNRFRGMAVDDMRFTFAHEDVKEAFPFGPEDPESESLGNPAFELDNIDVFPDLNINSSIFAFTLTAGITPDMDVSIALPIVNIRMSGNARAVINSFTYGRLLPGDPAIQGASHRYGGTLLDPVLEADTTYDVSTNGIGDIALRVKYILYREPSFSAAALADIRLPTGDERNFLGTGKANFRLLWIMSGTFGELNPHLNLGYDRRGGAFDSDEFEFVLGFDQKLTDALTFAIDLLGSFDMNEDEAIELFPGSLSIPESFQGGSVIREFDLSNIPERSHDNTLDIAFGLRAAPSDKIVLMGNILAPLNDGGLRSSMVVTLGLSVSI